MPDDSSFSGVADTGDASWLDVVPGGRSAYNFVVEHISRFNLIGLDGLPRSKELVRRIGLRAASAGDATSTALVASAQSHLTVIERAWQTLNDKLGSLLAQLRSVGLGVVPVVALAAIAGLCLTTAGGMWMFFETWKQGQEQIGELVEREVAAGRMSPEEAAKLLQGGSFGNWLDDQFDKVIVVGLVVGGAWWYLNKRGTRA